MHLQNASLQESKRRRVGDEISSSGGETLEVLQQPHPSVHRLLHLHGESACSPVHHGVAQLEKQEVVCVIALHWCAYVTISTLDYLLIYKQYY